MTDIQVMAAVWSFISKLNCLDSDPVVNNHRISDKAFSFRELHGDKKLIQFNADKQKNRGQTGWQGCGGHPLVKQVVTLSCNAKVDLANFWV